METQLIDICSLLFSSSLHVCVLLSFLSPPLSLPFFTYTVLVNWNQCFQPLQCHIQFCSLAYSCLPSNLNIHASILIDSMDYCSLVNRLTWKTRIIACMEYCMPSPLFYHIYRWRGVRWWVGVSPHPLRPAWCFFLFFFSADLFLTTNGPKFETWISKVIKPVLMSVPDQLCSVKHESPNSCLTSLKNVRNSSSRLQNFRSNSPQSDDAMQIKWEKPFDTLFINVNIQTPIPMRLGRCVICK